MNNTETYTWPVGRVFSKAEPNIVKLSDRELSIRAGQGDHEAFAELYRRHSSRVYSVCLRITRNPATAEDLMQEVFIHLYRKISTFRGESAFTTWLHRVAINQTLMHLRKCGVKFELTTEDGMMPEHVSAKDKKREDLAMVDRMSLENAIAKLPPGYRTVLVLYDIEGFLHEEIADMLKCSTGTTKSQLHKARLKLRTLLVESAAPERGC